MERNASAVVFELPESVVDGSLGNNLQNPRAIDVGHHWDVILTPAEALFIDPDVFGTGSAWGRYRPMELGSFLRRTCRSDSEEPQRGTPSQTASCVEVSPAPFRGSVRSGTLLSALGAKKLATGVRNPNDDLGAGEIELDIVNDSGLVQTD